MRYISFLGGGLALLLMIRQFLKCRTSQKRISATLFFCLFWNQFRYFFGGRLIINETIIPVPILTVIVLSAFSSRIYFKKISLPDWNWEPDFRLHYLLLVPSIIIDVIVCIHYVIKIEVIALSINVIHWAGGFFLVTVLLIGLFHMFSIFTFRNMTQQTWFVFGASLFIITTVVMGLSGLALQSDKLEKINSAMFTVVLILFFLISDLKPDLLEEFQGEIKKARYRKSTLQGCNKELIGERLENLMKKQNYYLEEECSLENTSARIGISPHQLSEFLNNDKNTSFPDYIKKFRIEYAKELLISQPGKTVLEIAFQAGFGNKTTFNDSFRQITNITPKQYRKNVKDYKS